MDEHPFIELIEKHDAAINRVCCSFCRDAEEREDLRQEIQMHLWIGWKGYRPEYKPITWIYRVALNTAVSWRRHRKRQIESIPLDTSDMPGESGLREQSAHLRSMIAMLPLADQRMINLYLDGFTTDEIGRMLGAQGPVDRVELTMRVANNGTACGGGVCNAA